MIDKEKYIKKKNERKIIVESQSSDTFIASTLKELRNPFLGLCDFLFTTSFCRQQVIVAI